MGCYNMNNTSLKACITRALKNEYENCKIYVKKQEKPTLPAFFVRYIDVAQESAGMDFYSQDYLVEVRYRPGNTIPDHELETHLELIGGQVVDLLFCISSDEIIARAENLDYEISDGVLIITGKYTVKKRIVPKQDPYMQHLEENEEVRKYG